MNRDNSRDPTPYAVYCSEDCGLQFLNEQEYEYAMDRPNQGWRCPKCGEHAEWDDECQETNPPENAPFDIGEKR